MEKTITIHLVDFMDTPYEVKIPSDTEYISGHIISGDMVMQYPFHFDTADCRIYNIPNGFFKVLKKNFYLLDGTHSSFEIQAKGESK